jgi:hypothetical protein
MEQGTKVFRAFVCLGPSQWWVDVGEVTGIVADGVPLVRCGRLLQPLDASWHLNQTECKRDAATALARHIGTLQAQLDKMRDEILHDDLTTEEAAA